MHFHLNPNNEQTLRPARARKLAEQIQRKIDLITAEYPIDKQESFNGYDTLLARLELVTTELSKQRKRWEQKR